MKIENNILLEISDADAVDGIITIPDYVTELADNTCNNLSYPVIGNGIVKAGNYCICNNKSEMSFPALKTVGDYCICDNKA